ncbi:cohesin domain-containing protein [Roseateles puraquae]|uniref:cohesin domain-containing protein n=1 Tax=Roseateles puraquae TaxID=431059 RepID=UPI0013036613|nr:cohesin domain-containing protein [Roseateles puraquae]
MKSAFLNPMRRFADPETLRRLITVGLCALMVTGCALDQRQRRLAEDAIAEGRLEEGMSDLARARSQRPDSVTLKVGELSLRTQLIGELIDKARAAESVGRFQEASETLQRALALEPANSRVQERLASLALAVTQKEKLDQVESLASAGRSAQALALAEQALRDTPAHAGLLAAQRGLRAKQREQEIASSQSSLAEKRPISLDFRDASLRTVLDVVSRNSGLNFVLDPAVKPEIRVTVFLKNTPVEEALDLLVNTHQLAKKVLDSKTVLIYPATPEKQKEHQEQVVRVFYLANADVRAASNFLKAMLRVKDPYVDEKSNVLALRDSKENIVLAEKLLAVFDANEPEVLLDVEVLEVTTNRLLQLGVSPPTTFSLTPLPTTPITTGQTNSGSSGSTATGITLYDLLRNLDSRHVQASIGGIAVNAKSSTGDVTTLANPKLRARNREKASVMIGDKIPVVTSTIGTGGFVSESISYQDVGLKLNVEPTIFPNDEVAIKMALEVSTLGAAVKSSGGSTAYQISTRNATTVLRLKDGETQLLAGLLSRNRESSKTGWPGLSEIPVLGRLFADHQDVNNQTELVLAVTPRVLRNVRQPLAHEAETWVGTELSPRLRPYGGFNVAPSAEEAPPKASAQQSTEPRKAGSPRPSTSAGEPMTPGGVFKLQLAGPAQVKSGQTFDVQLTLEASSPMRGLPAEVSFDTTRFGFVDAVEEPFFKQGDAETKFSKTIDANAGRVTLGVIRIQATGAQGQGKVATLRFKALEPSDSAEIRVTRATPLSLDAPAPAQPLPAPLVVKVLP